MFSVFLIALIPIIILFIFIGLIIKLFHSKNKSNIFAALLSIIFGVIFLAIGIVPILGTLGSISGSRQYQEPYPPMLFLGMSSICFLIMIPLAIISFCKR
ncbi:unnamed protein product [Commensalibacter communis]|nr:unnamed protein product [Commensalibacter communis]CAI3931800.1 unnamed protein product [Commensalibacter communis]